MGRVDPLRGLVQSLEEEEEEGACGFLEEHANRDVPPPIRISQRYHIPHQRRSKTGHQPEERPSNRKDDPEGLLGDDEREEGGKWREGDEQTAQKQRDRHRCCLFSSLVVVVAKK